MFRSLDSAGAKPSSGTASPSARTLLTELWRRVLEIEEVDSTSSFFEIGGDSFKAVQLTVLLEMVGYRLSILDIFEAPTMEEQLDLLAGQFEERR